MKLVFVFDAYRTLVDCPQWDTIKKTDPEIRELAVKWEKDRKTWSVPFLAKFDECIATEKISAQEIPGTRYALEKLAEQGALGIYSSATEESLPAMLTQAGLIDLFPNKRLVIPVKRLNNVPKTDPEAYRLLLDYLKNEGFEMKTFTDDDVSIVEVAVKSKAYIPTIYHLDRKAKGQQPQQKEGYIAISSLGQMNELKRR